MPVYEARLFSADGSLMAVCVDPVPNEYEAVRLAQFHLVDWDAVQCLLAYGDGDDPASLIDAKPLYRLTLEKLDPEA